MLVSIRTVTIIFILAAGMMTADPIAAQTDAPEEECLPDEIDMGDYCASLPPTVTEAEKKQRTVTRFRGTSMMPGVVKPEDRKKTPEAKPVKMVDRVPPPVERPLSGKVYFIQLGAFSTEAHARSVVQSVESADMPVEVRPLVREDRTLWLSTVGPFADETQAVAIRDILRNENRFSTAYITSINLETQKGASSGSTEK